MSEPLESRLSRFIRQRREQLDMSQEQLALFLDVSPADVVLLESGHLRLDLNKFDQLAEALATERTYLCLMVALEGRSPIFQKYFGDWLLAEAAKGAMYEPRS
jgi:transcriptional regulator with XRE-family HTH domain